MYYIYIHINVKSEKPKEVLDSKAWCNWKCIVALNLINLYDHRFQSKVDLPKQTAVYCCFKKLDEIGVPQTIGFPLENDNELESLNDSLRSSQLEKETPDHPCSVSPQRYPLDIYIYIILSHYILLYSTVSHYIELYSIVFITSPHCWLYPHEISAQNGGCPVPMKNIPLITFLAKIQKIPIE